jgi:hypothetical protein
MIQASNISLWILNLVLSIASTAVFATSTQSESISTGKTTDQSSLAEPPTAADIDAIEHLFGFDQMIPGVLDRAIDTAKEVKDLDQAQRICVKHVTTPLVAREIHNFFAKVFERREYVVSWIEFADTDIGHKYTALLRQGVIAISLGQPPPGKEEIQNSFDDNERAKIATFMHTPSGGAFVDGMKKIGLFISPEFAKEISSQARQQCQVDLDSVPADKPVPADAVSHE